MKLFGRLSPWGRRYLVVVLLIILVAGSFNAGLLTERYRQIWGPQPAAVGSNGNVPPELQAEFENFLQVWALVQREYYYGTPTGSALDYGASRGLLSTLGDDYTTFLEPVQQQGVREQMSGDYEGVGVYLEAVDGRWVVSSPIKGAPADLAGLVSRDAILRVDGKEIGPLSIDDVQKMLRGKAGTVVHVSVQRPGVADTLELDITRAVINIPSVRLQMREGNIALITVTIFGDKTTAQFDEELKSARDAGAKGIILDLRNNGGGWVQAAQEMIGRFVDPARGPALLEDKDNGAQARVLLYTPTAAPPVGAGTPTAVIPTNTPAVLNVANPKKDPIIGPQNGGATYYDIPLVVLVNGGTASASEIVIGALQDYGRVTTVGVRTYGKGSIQAVHEFKDGSSARITIAQWLTPKGRVIQKQGLYPDIVVDNPPSGEDAQLAKAIEAVRGKLGVTP
jgi:carboxyl-terminal processing protease